MRLIDADTLHKALSAKQKWVVHCGGKHNEGYTSDQVHFAIDDTPTVDPIKHGHWIFNPKDAIEMMFTLPICSECGAESSDGGNYCSNCGAKMDGAE